MGSLRSSNACRVCGGKTAFALTAREMLFGTREAFDYDACEDCGCVQLRLGGEDAAPIEDAYPSAYYTKVREPKMGRIGGWSGWRRLWTRFRLGEGRIRRALSGRRYARFDWFRRTGIDVGDGILDVGCGSGRLLAHLRADGFSDLTGLDPQLSNERSGRPGLRWVKGEIEQHAGEYDLVMAHHSFEHMRDPRRAMRAMAGLIAPGGFLLLRVPRADSWAFRHYGADWCQLDAPRHLHLLTRKSVEVLCAEAGLRVSHVEDDSGPFQIWGSELYRDDVALGESKAQPVHVRLRRRLDRFRVRRRARALRREGLGDQACFYLEKRA